jgi:osmotically inducible protein OsmC
VTWASRTGQPGGKTSPEELAAAAHSSCFALALRLGERKAAAQRLTIAATVTWTRWTARPRPSRPAFGVRGRVPGLDVSGFQEAVGEAAALCPVSRLFAGAEISVTATLDPAP